MRKIMVLAVSVCALAGLGVASSVAMAGGNGAVTTHIGPVSYTDPFFGPVTHCTGENVFKAGQFNKDSEDCTIVNGATAGTYSLALGNYPGWLSDSKAPSRSAGLVATSVTIVVTDNGNGTSNENIVAYYSGL